MSNHAPRPPSPVSSGFSGTNLSAAGPIRPTFEQNGWQAPVAAMTPPAGLQRFQAIPFDGTFFPMQGFSPVTPFHALYSLQHNSEFHVGREGSSASAPSYPTYVHRAIRAGPPVMAQIHGTTSTYPTALPFYQHCGGVIQYGAVLNRGANATPIAPAHQQPVPTPPTFGPDLPPNHSTLPLFCFEVISGSLVCKHHACNKRIGSSYQKINHHLKLHPEVLDEVKATYVTVTNFGKHIGRLIQSSPSSPTLPSEAELRDAQDVRRWVCLGCGKSFSAKHTLLTHHKTVRVCSGSNGVERLFWKLGKNRYVPKSVAGPLPSGRETPLQPPGKVFPKSGVYKAIPLAEHGTRDFSDTEKKMRTRVLDFPQSRLKISKYLRPDEKNVPFGTWFHPVISQMEPFDDRLGMMMAALDPPAIGLEENTLSFLLENVDEWLNGYARAHVESTSLFLRAQMGENPHNLAHNFCENVDQLLIHAKQLLCFAWRHDGGYLQCQMLGFYPDDKFIAARMLVRLMVEKVREQYTLPVVGQYCFVRCFTKRRNDNAVTLVPVGTLATTCATVLSLLRAAACSISFAAAVNQSVTNGVVQGKQLEEQQLNLMRACAGSQVNQFLSTLLCNQRSFRRDKPS